MHRPMDVQKTEILINFSKNCSNYTQRAFFSNTVNNSQPRPLTWPSNSSKMPDTHSLFVITGMPAVGKSTFARELAQKTKACLIDIDTTTESIVRAAMARLTNDPNDRDSPFFKKTLRDPIYQTLFSIADENLPHTDAIINGPFTQEMHNPDWPTEIQSRQASPCRVKCIYLHCDDELRKKRIIERANPRDSSKLENWEHHISYYKTRELPSYPHILVDTGRPDCLARAIEDGLLL